jgi:hypothetical protein
MLRRAVVSLAALWALSLAGCVSQQTRKVIDLAPFKRIHVIQRLGDDRRLNTLFVAELQRHGHEATTGPRTMLPENADAVLTYSDRWEWDFKNYLIELNFELHTARTNKKLADGRYFQPTPRPSPPEQVIADLVKSLFKP